MISVATDLSPESLAAVHWAHELALSMGQASLRVIYVVENEFHELPGSAPLLQDAGIAHKLEKRITERLSEELGEFPFELELREGRPQTEIEAATRESELLVLGTSPDSFARFALGSIPERLCHNPPAPIAVVRPDRALGESPTWIVGVDFSSHSSPTLDLAVNLANAVGAHLKLVHVVPIPSPVVVSDESIMRIELDSLPVAQARVWAAERMKAFVEANQARLTGVSFEAEVIEGYPVISLVDAIEACDADAVVVGTAGRSSLGDRLMGSVAYGLVKRMPTNVILAPAD